VKGATDHWFDRFTGIRKRYGKLLTVAEGGGGPPTVMSAPYLEYCLLRRGRDSDLAPTEDPANHALFWLEGFGQAKGDGKNVEPQKKRAAKRAGAASNSRPGQRQLVKQEWPLSPGLAGDPQPAAAAAAAEPIVRGPPRGAGGRGPIAVGQSRFGRQRTPTARAAAAVVSTADVVDVRSQRSDAHTRHAAANPFGGGAAAAGDEGGVGGDVLAAPLDICTSRPQKKRFVSFQATPPSGDGSIDLGAMVRVHQGVKLESRQGNFAEWRSAGEPPFLEGEVVGVDSQGRLSRHTDDAKMMGVISRSAVVEGSAPPQGDRASDAQQCPHLAMLCLLL
jgi:hypothetical protein